MRGADVIRPALGLKERRRRVGSRKENMIAMRWTCAFTDSL